jgi:LysM repeat protein
MQNIVNPYPETYTSTLPTPVRTEGVITAWENMSADYGINKGERRGLDYDYENKRNRWVLDIFHTGLLTNVGYSAIGEDFSFGVSLELKSSYGITMNNRYITLADALAYAALYPQNAKVIRSKTKAGNPRNPRINGRTFSLELVGGKEKQKVLDQIASRLASNENSTSLNTVTTAAAQQPANQASANKDRAALKSPLPKSKHVVKEGETLTKIAQRYNTTTVVLLEANPIREATDDDPGFSNPPVAGQTVVLPHSEASSQIPELVPSMSDQRIKDLLRAVGSDDNASIEKVVTQTNKSIAEANKIDDPSLDLLDWKNNVGSNTAPTKPSDFLASSNDSISQTPTPEPKNVYYNSDDKHWYAVTRTHARNPMCYDQGLATAVPRGPIGNNVSAYKRKAASLILKKAEKYTTRNYNRIKNSNQIVFDSFYGTPGRPQPIPEGSDTWILGVKIPTKVIDDLKSSGGSSKKDEMPSPLRRARQLATDPGPNRRIPFQMDTLKTNLKHTKNMLKTYYRELDEEGITPSMMGGINLEEEAEKLESFPLLLEEWATNKKITVADSDKFELVLDDSFAPKTMFYNGAEFGSLPTDTAAEKFLSVSSTTYGLVFYSRKISDLRSKVRKSQRPSATEFVTKYIFPSPTIRPTDLQNKVSENKITGQYPQEASGKGVGSNSFSKQKIVEKKDASFKTKQQVNKEFERRLQYGSQMLGGYVSVLNSAGCETPLAKYLNDAFALYQLIGGKTTIKQLVGTVIKVIRDDIVISKKKEILLLRGAGYLDDPTQLDRDIENFVNKEIQCAFRLLGDVLEKEVLDPGGVPPGLTTAIKKGLMPPRGVKLGKTPTADLMKLWREQLFELLLAFIKGLIMEAFKELLLAAAGCGGQQTNNPQQSGGKPSPSNRAPSPYGNVRINELIDDDGTIDLESVAAELGIKNSLYRDGQITNTPATINQLRQLNDDSSDVMVDLDVAAILQGTGPTHLVDVLYRTYNLGVLDINSISAELREQITSDPPQVTNSVAKAIISEFQESLTSGDTRYGSLNLTRENIIKYFKRIGQLLGADVVLELTEPLDPKTAYCDSRDILSYGLGAAVDVGLLDGAEGSSVLAGGLSRDQLLKQIDQQIDADVSRILSLCDLSADGFNFVFEIQNFWDRLPFSNWFRDFLDALRRASQDAQNIQAKAVTAAMTSKYREPEYQFVPPTETEIYNYYDWYFGNQTFAGNQDEGGLACRLEPDSDKLFLRKPHFKVGKYNFATNRGLISDGEVMLHWVPDEELNLAAGKAQIRFRTRDPVKQTPGSDPESAEILAEISLDQSRGMRYSIQRGVNRSQRGRQDGFTAQHVTAINNLINKSVSLSFGDYPTVGEDYGGESWNSYSKVRSWKVGVNIIRENRDQPPYLTSDLQLSVPFANNLNNIKRAMGPNLYGNTYYYDRRGNREFDGLDEQGRPIPNEDYNPRSGEPRFKNRVDETIQRASTPVFNTNGDPCNIVKEEEAAIATLGMIQQRMFNFVLNIAPLFNAGYSLMTPDTFNMISSYLFNKIKKDFEAKKLQAIAYKGLEFVAATCSKMEQGPGERVIFNPASESDPMIRLEYVVNTMLKQMFHNLSTSGIDPDNQNRFRGWGYITRDYFKDIREAAMASEVPRQGAQLNVRDKYELLTRWLYRGNLGGGPLANGFSGQAFDLGFRGMNSFDDEVEDLREREFRDEMFLGYFPIPLLVALQVIYFDKVIDLSNNFPQVAYYANKRIQEADKSAKILIQETAVPTSAAPFYEQIRRVAYNLEAEQEEQQQDDAEAEDRARQLRDAEPDQGAPRDDDQGQQLAGRLAQAGMGPPPPQQEDENEQGERQEGGRDPQDRERHDPPQYPVTVRGQIYRNLAQLRAASQDLGELKRRVEELQRINSRAQSLIRTVGADLKSAENEYLNNRGWPTNKFTGNSNPDKYKNFCWDNPMRNALRKRLWQAINDRSWRGDNNRARSINAASSLGITAYGGVTGPRAPGRAWNQGTDLRIRDQYSITQLDLTTTRQIIGNDNPNENTMNQRIGAALEQHFIYFRSGTTSSWAGLRDGMESTKFYRHICYALRGLVGDNEGWLGNAANHKSANNSGGVPQGNWGYSWVEDDMCFLGLISLRIKKLDELRDENLLTNNYGGDFRVMNQAKYTELSGLVEEINNALQERA